MPPRVLTFLLVDDTVETWRQATGCPAAWTVGEFASFARDGTLLRRHSGQPGRDGAEVVLIEIEGGGQPNLMLFPGKPTRDILANDLLWEFFKKTSLPPRHDSGR